MNKIELTELTNSEIIEVNGGDGMTEAFFWVLGRFFQAQQRDLDGSIDGPTAIHG